MPKAMMKLSLVVLASALAAVDAARDGGAVRKTMTELRDNRIFRSGDPTTEAMLEKAIPFFSTSNGISGQRRLQQAYDGSFNLKFSRCVDVKTYDDMLFESEDMIDDVKDGNVASVRSYVLFHVCEATTCNYDAEDDLYVIDLPTYLTGVARYHANKRNDYCQQCEMFADTCNPAAAEEEGEDAAAGGEEVVEEAAGGEEAAGDGEEADGGEQQGQEEQNNNAEQENENDQEGQAEGDQEAGQEEEPAEERELKQAIDCAQCATYECFADDADLDDAIQGRGELDESVSQWIAELAACKYTGEKWNDIDLFMSAMCSPYGDGVELAVYLDDACTLYTASESVYNVLGWKNNNGEDGINYLAYAEEFIKSAFSEVTSCLLQEYVDPNEAAADEEDAEQEYRMNDYCTAVLEADVADFNNCEADVEAQEDPDDQFNWYEYDLRDANDINQVCAVINQKEGIYTYSYNSKSSGTWYKRDRNGAIISTRSYYQVQLSPAIIGGIVAACIVFIGGIAFLLRPKKVKPQEESVYQGGVMM